MVCIAWGLKPRHTIWGSEQITFFFSFFLFKFEHWAASLLPQQDSLRFLGITHKSRWLDCDIRSRRRPDSACRTKEERRN